MDYRSSHEMYELRTIRLRRFGPHSGGLDLGEKLYGSATRLWRCEGDVDGKQREQESKKYTNLVSNAPPRPPWHDEVGVNGRKGEQVKKVYGFGKLSSKRRCAPSPGIIER